MKDYFENVVMHNINEFLALGPFRISLIVCLMLCMVFFITPPDRLHAAESANSGSSVSGVTTTNEQWDYSSLNDAADAQADAETHASILKVLKVGLFVIMCVIIIVLVFGGVR